MENNNKQGEERPEDNYTVHYVHHTGIHVIALCKKFKIDRRCKPFFWNHDLVCNVNYTHQCSGCDGGGCHECGYTGKRVGCFPNLLLSNYKIVNR